jgi:hypothetical protein
VTSPVPGVEWHDAERVRRSLQLVLLALIALLVAFALLAVGNEGAEPSKPPAAAPARAPTAAPANTSAELAGAAEPIAPVDAEVIASSARTEIDAGASRTAADASPATGVIRGRVIVAAGRSPKGLSVRLRLAIPSRDPIVLDADGRFEFTDLTARTYQLEASGLDDIVWRPERYRVVLARGEVFDFDWDLSDRCPAIVDVQLTFDGLSTASSIEPWGELQREGPLLVTDAAGRARVRVAGDQGVADEAIGALRVFASNAIRGEAPPAVLCIGQPLAPANLAWCTQQPLVIDVHTALVRVLAGAGEAGPLPRAGGRLSCSIHAEVELTEHAMAPVRTAWLGRLELDTTRAPLATFRAGPGRYTLESMAKDGEWHATLVVTRPGEAVDCRFERF